MAALSSDEDPAFRWYSVVANVRDGLKEEAANAVTMNSDDTIAWLLDLFEKRNLDLDDAHTFVERLGGSKDGHSLWGLHDTPDLDSYRRLADLMGSIVDFFCHTKQGKSDDPIQRKAIVTGHKAVPNAERQLGQYSSKPDIMIVGHDTAHLPDPLSSYQHQSPETEPLSLKVQLYRDFLRGQDYFPGCVAAGDIKALADWGNDDLRGSTCLSMATYAEACFSEQLNRHSIFTFAFYGQMLQLFHFDRAGIVRTTPFDIEQNPEIFVLSVALLAGHDIEAAGFDPTVCYDGEGVRHITVPGSEKDRFRVTGVLYSDHNCIIEGRGTICWDAIDKRSNRQVLIKDAWRHATTTCEADFLKKGMGAEGINQLVVSHDFDPALMSTFSYRLDLDNTRFKDCDVDFYHRLFSRIVVEKEGKSVECFQSRLQLLQAFKDGIKGHRNLLDAGILHRDISLNNILLKADGSGGILIDLDSAIDLKALEVQVGMGKFRAGTYDFKSTNLLRRGFKDKRVFHSFEDDLESFTYSLVYIFMDQTSQQSGGQKSAEVHPLLVKWSDPDEMVARRAKLFFKEGYFNHEFDPVPHFRYPVFFRLVNDLRKLIYSISKYREPASYTSKVPIGAVTKEKRDEIYSQIIGFFDQAIAELATTNFNRVYTDTELEEGARGILPAAPFGANPAHVRPRRGIGKTTQPEVLPVVESKATATENAEDATSKQLKRKPKVVLLPTKEIVKTHKIQTSGRPEVGRKSLRLAQKVAASTATQPKEATAAKVVLTKVKPKEVLRKTLPSSNPAPKPFIEIVVSVPVGIIEKSTKSEPIRRRSHRLVERSAKENAACRGKRKSRDEETEPQQTRLAKKGRKGARN